MTDALLLDIEREVRPVNDLANEYIYGNPDLPIAQHRAEIVDAIHNNSVTILVGTTGSGKSTQVAQYAHEMLTDGQPTFDQIRLTQPRRVAARTVQERVAEELANARETANTERDQLIAHVPTGFFTGVESSPEPQADQRILYCTDGKVAAQLLYQGKLRRKTLLCIDEVHERNVHIDLLLAIVTERTDPKSPEYDPNLKVVIMSATIDAVKLQDHFKHLAPPIIEVKVPIHKVTRSVTTDSVASVALHKAIATEGKVLVFVPTKRAINNLADDIAKKQGLDPNKIPVFSLHGQQTPAEQLPAFLDYPKGAIVIATNVAETSLTVPGLTAVVDSGLAMIDRVDYDLVPTGSETLNREDISQASSTQRKGRVGREQEGEYISALLGCRDMQIRFEDRPKYTTPAIERTRLDDLVLKLSATGRTVDDFRWFHKPPEVAVQAAKTRLITLGAITQDGLITARGRWMSKLALEPEYSCMIAFAHEKGYGNDVKRHVLDIAAIMQSGGILKRAPKEQKWRDLLEKNEADEVKEKDSDLFAQLEVYLELINMVHPKDWGKYDIHEHAATKVEEKRAKLLEELGMPMHEATTIAFENRQAVLECINAGQLNQVWRRNGEVWSLAVDKSLEYDLSESTVVDALGTLATGTLFSLGLSHDTLHSVQNVTITSLQSIERVAGHLWRDEVDELTIRFDSELMQTVATVKRRLGGLVLRTFVKPYELEHDTAEHKALLEAHRNSALKRWAKVTPIAEPYTREGVMSAIDNPERSPTPYTADPATGEPLYAWLGHDNKWCLTSDIAKASLTAGLRKIDNAAKNAELRQLKDSIKQAETALRALKNVDAKALLGSRKKSDKKEWLHRALELLEGITTL